MANQGHALKGVIIGMVIAMVSAASVPAAVALAGLFGMLKLAGSILND